jgi:hypothetical protein
MKFRGAVAKQTVKLPVSARNTNRGLIAQLEERGVCNAEAMGSNPIGSTFDAPGDASHQGRVEGHLTRRSRVKVCTQDVKWV